MTRTIAAIIAVIAIAAPWAGAQAPVAEWLFDDDIEGFACTDPTAQMTSTNDANIVREEDNGVLELSYTPTKTTLVAAIGELQEGLAGGQSLMMHLRTTDQTIVLVGVVEADGSSYNTAFTSLPDRWQEVAIDFAEFELGNDSTDENGQLDPDQVATIMVADAVIMLAMMADQVPFFVAPDLSPRMMWIDDMWVDSEGVDPRWIKTETGIQVDSFEAAPLQWACVAGTGLEVAYDKELKTDGNNSLRIAYDLPAGKLFIAMTGLQAVPLEGMTRLSLSYLSEVATTLLLEIEEVDGSKYSTLLPVVAGDDFSQIDMALAELTLGNDSEDENDQLDITQAKQLVIGDLSAMVGDPVLQNTLWLDDLSFAE